jgi:hypothetical protein
MLAQTEQPERKATPQDLYDRALERADSVQDVRHRFVANFTGSTPNKGMALFRNFEFSSIINLQAPRAVHDLRWERR